MTAKLDDKKIKLSLYREELIWPVMQWRTFPKLLNILKMQAAKWEVIIPGAPSTVHGNLG